MRPVHAFTPILIVIILTTNRRRLTRVHGKIPHHIEIRIDLNPIAPTNIHIKHAMHTTARSPRRPHARHGPAQRHLRMIDMRMLRR